MGVLGSLMSQSDKLHGNRGIFQSLGRYWAGPFDRTNTARLLNLTYLSGVNLIHQLLGVNLTHRLPGVNLTHLLPRVNLIHPLLRVNLTHLLPRVNLILPLLTVDLFYSRA